jgi:hypothetical protein
MHVRRNDLALWSPVSFQHRDTQYRYMLNMLNMLHAARELPPRRVGPENRRKNAKGFPEDGAPPTFKAPARYNTIRGEVIQKAE